MKRVFFIDSENVGDNWTLMLDNVEADDELLVFYTQKSPHMSYRNLIHLKESSKDVTFIECFEGSNALDFQLVSELGYRIAKDADCRYYIITNDTGFESAVKYWRKKNISIKRLPGKACASIGKPVAVAENTEDTSVLITEAAAEEISAEQAKPAEVITPADEEQSRTAETDASKEPDDFDPLIVEEEPPKGPDDQSMEVLYYVGKDNLADLHEALVQLYGDKRCQLLYNLFKSDPAYDAFLAGHEVMSPEERQRAYCGVVFACAGKDGNMPDDFTDIVMKSWKRKNNLNSVRAALISKYGKENALQYYSLIKAHIKILGNIS